MTDAERVAERARVDVGVVAADHAVLLEPRQPLGDRGRREPDAAAELGERQPRVLLQLGEQAEVGVVDRPRSAVDSQPSQRRLPSFGHVRQRRRAAIAAGRMRRPPPHLYFVVSAIFHYLGPAFAVLLFARVDVLGVAWLRIASAALVFALWRRPWRVLARLDRDGRRLLLRGAPCSR